ncbi:MAG: TonB-dependent receptor [Ponticaulis sp.]|nr:TonB-dependent receptor [Ponticaulis sp.]
MKTLLISSVSALGLTVVSAPAMAQDNADAAPLVQNTITVTVQKREQSLRDVPVAVTALDQTTLDDLGLDEFDQIARFVPGFEVQEQSPNNPGFVIRGITSDSGEANIEPRIAIFQDGVSISRSRGSVVELFDVERVEVAKGPQPTLFGRGALIGGVNVIQAKPEFELSGKIAAGVGNLNERFFEGYITGPLVEDKLAGRLAARIRQRDGYVESLNPNEEDFNSQDMAAVRASLRFEPTADLRFDLIANWQTDEPSGTSFKSGAFDPLPGYSSEAWEPANLNSFGGMPPLGLERTVTSITALADWDISETLSLSSITGWRDIDSVEIFDPDGFGLDLLIFGEDYQGEQFSQEFRLNFDSGDKLTGFVGASYLDETGSQYVPLTYDERAAQALLGGLLVPPNAPPASAFPAINLTAFAQSGGTVVIPLKPIHMEQFTNFGETQAFDIFADASYQLTDRLEISGGLRYTTEDKTSGLNVSYLNGPSALTGAGLFVNASGGLIEQSETFDDVTYRLAASFAVTDEVNLFANFGRGRRPEVITASATTPSAGFAVLDAEIVDAWETGFKGLFLNGDLSIDGSIFYYDYSNFQTTIVTAAGLIEPVNAGDATAKGGEIQAIWSLSDMVALTANYGYNKARFDDDASALNPGNRLRLSPDSTASVSARFLFDLGFADLKIVPSYTWQDKVYFDNTERDLISQDSYGLLNLNAKLDFNNGFGAEAYISNALDEEYLIDAGNTGDGFGIPTFISGPPQFYGVRVSKTF